MSSFERKVYCVAPPPMATEGAGSSDLRSVCVVEEYSPRKLKSLSWMTYLAPGTSEVEVSVRYAAEWAVEALSSASSSALSSSTVVTGSP